MLRYTTDRARPGLVTLYDIWPGNGAGQFLQPRSPHGALQVMEEILYHTAFQRSSIVLMHVCLYALHYSSRLLYWYLFSISYCYTPL